MNGYVSPLEPLHKMKKNLVILGAGPRGIATAIQAIKYKDRFNIYIIDPTPISTWKFPNMVTDMKMRSPITFDLVTYQKDLKEYSLSNYLNQFIQTSSQQLIESNNIFCSRKEFVAYLNHCLNQVLLNGAFLIKNTPIEINKTEVVFKEVNIPYDYLVIATGKYTEDLIVPNYLKGLHTCLCPDIYNSDWNNKQVYVVGSGQFSAEIVDYLTDNLRAQVYWVTKYNQKVEQYPVPSYEKWKKLSALGPYYYNNLSEDINRSKYLKQVKKWGPTITPYIANKLKDKNNKFGIVNPQNIKLNKQAVYLLALGRKQNLYNLPLTFRFPNSNFRQNVPYLSKTFNNSRYSNIYFTGQLALEVGGPQQGSIISSGFTSEIIMSSIISKL